MTLDRRLNAFRDDLADIALRETVAATRYTESQPAVVVTPVADLLSTPRPDAGLDSQLLLGDRVAVFERAGGFAWVQSERDGYVGYVAVTALSEDASEPTHLVWAPRSFVYTEADLKSPRRAVLSMGSAVAVSDFSATRGTQYARLAPGGFMIAAHLRPVHADAPDFVAIAELLAGTPYLWGGASAFGIDCSGLVQLSMRMAGRRVLRDTDMQRRSIGTEIDLRKDLSSLQRGDLVFWKGHVAIMLDDRAIIHANGHTMTVATEPLAAAVERIAYLYGGPIGARRP